MPEATVTQLVERLALENGDIVFFGADKRQVVNDALGALRLKVAEMMSLVGDGWAPLWVVDFPMFEETGEGGLTALHHPFTAPSCDVNALTAEPQKVLSRAYDMVLNGSEIGGGSIRIHRQEMQKAVFDVLGISAEEAEAKFGFLLAALKHGAPPHGGLAFGLDPFSDADGRRPIYPGRDCLPQDAVSAMRYDRRTRGSIGAAASRSQHTVAQSRKVIVATT